jgi:hypothetical protein
MISESFPSKKEEHMATMKAQPIYEEIISQEETKAQIKQSEGQLREEKDQTSLSQSKDDIPMTGEMILCEAKGHDPSQLQSKKNVKGKGLKKRFFCNEPECLKSFSTRYMKLIQWPSQPPQQDSHRR